MKVFITIEDGVVYIESRVVDERNNIGDIFEEIGPNDFFLGVSYAEFVEHGDGEMEIEGGE